MGVSPLNPKKKTTMAYGLFRVRNLSASEVNGTEIHNFRQYDNLGIEKPENLFTEGTRMGDTHSFLYNDEGMPMQTDEGMADNIKHKLDRLGISPRKNSVVALEYAVGASKEFFVKGNYSAQAFLEKAVDFVAKKHGYENVVSVSYHYDEHNPHAHVVVLPISEKTVKWKNKRASGERTEKRLCARDFTGGPEKLSKMQEEYYEFCKPFERYSNGEVKFYRGTKAEEQLKRYTKQTSHEFAIIRDEIDKTKTLSELKEKLFEKVPQMKEMIKDATELQKRVEIHKEKNRGEGWKKGRDFEMGF